MGPCYLPANKTGTAPNPYSWNNKASLLFIDQPAGVGFSQLKEGTPYVAGDQPSAVDLQVFLRMFFETVFPSKAKLPIHFTGESYGGHYVPVTMKHILESREAKAEDAFWGNITSVILVSPVIHDLQITYGHYQLMCTDYRGHKGHRWNETVCKKVAASMPEGEFLALSCDLSYDGRACLAMDQAAEYSLDVLLDDENLGLVDSHNVDKPCVNVPYCDRPDRGNMTAYLNEPSVLHALGFSSSYEWDIANYGASNIFRDVFDASKPTTREVATVLDASHLYPSQKDPIRLLVLNGNLDATCGTTGQQWVFENMRWTGAAGYRAAGWAVWEKLGLGMGDGLWKASEDGQLVFVGVDGAGHMVPLDQPEIADVVVRKWISGSLGE